MILSGIKPLNQTKFIPEENFLSQFLCILFFCSQMALLCLCAVSAGYYLVLEVKGASKAGLSWENGEVEEDVFNHDPWPGNHPQNSG